MNILVHRYKHTTAQRTAHMRIQLSPIRARTEHALATYVWRLALHISPFTIQRNLSMWVSRCDELFVRLCALYNCWTLVVTKLQLSSNQNIRCGTIAFSFCISLSAFYCAIKFEYIDYSFNFSVFINNKLLSHTFHIRYVDLATVVLISFNQSGWYFAMRPNLILELWDFPLIRSFHLCVLCVRWYCDGGRWKQ